jgi:hypothetical protein
VSDLYLNRFPATVVARWSAEISKRLPGHQLERITIDLDGSEDARVEVTLNYGGFEGVHQTAGTSFTYSEPPGRRSSGETLRQIGLAVEAAICYVEGR